MGTYMSLKAVVQYGQLLGLERYPTSDIFPKNPTRWLHVEDELSSREVPLEVVAQIVEALKAEKNIVLKTMIMVAKDTGLRISELLSLRLDSLVDDFMDNPYLFVYSIKQDKDRVIPIQKRLTKAIHECIDHTSKYRTDNNILFISPVGDPIPQNRAREALIDFLIRHEITDPEDDRGFAHITWHQFRHSLGTDALNDGMSPSEVKKLLGHDSWHSTSLYSKIRAITLRQEYKKIGFVGVVAKDVKDIEKSMTEEELKSGALPDGLCKKAFDGETSCKSFNKCLLCSKFITTPEYLEIHKQHLTRIHEDRMKYMDDTYICNLDKVQRIEDALVSIIEQLEALV